MRDFTDKKTSFIIILGNLLEFYDLGLYGFLAPKIVPLYFPVHNTFSIMIASLAVFAAGFIMRPIGSIIFGWIGDFLGRKIVLTHTMLFMAVPTFLIAILPTYEQIGLLSSILLVLCRLVQGACTGGEYNSAAIFLLEKSPRHKRGFYSGLITASSIGGFFLASLMSMLIDYLPLHANAWRIPFLIGASIGVLGFYYRSTALTESPYFQKPEVQSAVFSWTDLKQNKKNILLMIIFGWFAGTLSLSLIGYIPTHLASIENIASREILLITNLGILIYMVCLPIFGFISDKTGIQRLMKIAILCMSLSAYIIFSLFCTGDLFYISIGVVLLALCAASFLGPMHAFFLNIFPMSFRCRGISLSFSVGAGILGGTAPLIYTFLIEFTKTNKAPAFYFIVCSIITLLAIRNKELNKQAF